MRLGLVFSGSSGEHVYDECVDPLRTKSWRDRGPNTKVQ